MGLVLGLLAGALVISETVGRGDRTTTEYMRNSAAVFFVVGLAFGAFATLEVLGAISGNTLSTVLCYAAAVAFMDLARRIWRSR